MFKRPVVVAVATGTLCMAAAWAGPVADRLIAFGHDPLRVPGKERTISFMPRPQPVDSSGDCQKTEFRFESEAAKQKAGWTGASYQYELNEWAVAHWGARAGSRKRAPWCIDGEFSTRAWQAALRDPPTGVLTALQMARLVNVVDNLDESHRRHKERQALVRRDRGLEVNEEEPAASLLANVSRSDDGATVSAFGFLLAEPLALPLCPTANTDSTARICFVPSYADRAHPNRALEFQRMDLFVPDGSPKAVTVANGLVSIQFPLRQRPDFLPRNLVGLRGFVAQGRLVGLAGFVEPSIDMVSRFRDLYGEPVLTRVGVGSGSRLVLSYKTGNGTAKLDCDGEAIQCTFAQVLTNTAPKLLRGIVIEPQRAGDGRNSSDAQQQAQRNMREHVEQVSNEMMQNQQRISEQARREEAEERDRVNRQNEQIRRQQEMLQEEERRRRATVN